MAKPFKKPMTLTLEGAMIEDRLREMIEAELENFGNNDDEDPVWKAVRKLIVGEMEALLKDSTFVEAVRKTIREKIAKDPERIGRLVLNKLSTDQLIRVLTSPTPPVEPQKPAAKKPS